MTELFGLISKFISEENVWMVFVVIFVFLLFKTKTIVDFWDDRRRAKIGKIKEALACESISGLTRVHLESELEKEFCRLATGLSYEKEFREAIVKAHQKCKGEIGFRHFRRCQDNLRYEGGVLSIELGLWDKWKGNASLIGALFLYFAGFFLMITSFSLYTDDIGKLLKTFAMGALFIPFSFWMGLEYATYLSTKYVSKELAKQSS